MSEGYFFKGEDTCLWLGPGPMVYLKYLKDILVERLLSEETCDAGYPVQLFGVPAF
mgnify:CR=1 FL=1